MGKRVPIVAVSFHVPGTGLTRIMHCIARSLSHRFDFHYVGLGYSGNTIRDGVTIYPSNSKGGDVLGAFQAKELVIATGAPLIFLLHDVWNFAHYSLVLDELLSRTACVGYVPLDGRFADVAVAAPLACLTKLVAYCDFARDEYRRAFIELEARHESFRRPTLETIPHGVDVDRFAPTRELLSESFATAGRAGAKAKVFPDIEFLRDAFIVLNASRPAKRKRIDLTLRGFARFARDKPKNVILCLHHAIRGDAEREATSELAAELGITERLRVNPLNPGGGPLSDEDLNLLYNACDVGLNTSMGEGWGLVSFEHAATGAAQVVPSHSACAELWRGCAELVPTVERSVPPFSTLEMEAVSAEGVADALERLYVDRARLREISAAGYRNAHRPEYRWDAIAERWAALLFTTLDDNARGFESDLR
jgi:D-inositol-3-phosphate glycosyltransferase